MPDPDENEQLTYDILGNRLTLNNRAGSEIVYTSNVVNEYTAIGGAMPLYDACGNLTRDIHGYTYHYDNDNRITQIKKNNDADEVAAYTYDALGRRIRKYDAIADAAVRCYYDDQRVLLETDDSNNDQRAFVYGNYIDEVLVMTDYTGEGDPDYYYGHDHLYSVAVIFEADGAVYERAEYNAYGEPTRLDPDFTPWSGTEIGNCYYFTGRNLDTLNNGTFKIYYYRARYYDPETGRFLQRDPIGYADSSNLYEFVGSSPILALDPFGLYINPRAPLTGIPIGDRAFKGLYDYIIGGGPIKDIYGKIKDALTPDPGTSLTDILSDFSIIIGGTTDIPITSTGPINLFPPSPIWLTLNLTFGGRLYDCCNKGKKEQWGEGSAGIKATVRVGGDFTNLVHDPTGRGSETRNIETGRWVKLPDGGGGDFKVGMGTLPACPESSGCSGYLKVRIFAHALVASGEITVPIYPKGDAVKSGSLGLFKAADFGLSGEGGILCRGPVGSTQTFSLPGDEMEDPGWGGGSH